MKFTVSKSTFINKLTPAMGTVSNKGTITAIEGVLIETVDGQIRISTYDMTKGVRSTFDAIEIEREGKFIINAQRLYQTIRVMPEDEVTIDVNDKLNCTISSGKASFSMFAMKGEDFPNLPELSGERGFTLPQAEFKKIVSQISHAIAQNDQRPAINGAFITIKGSKMTAVATDGSRIALREKVCEFGNLNRSGEELDLEFIVPGKALGEVMKLLEGEGDVTIMLGRKHAILQKGQTLLSLLKVGCWTLQRSTGRKDIQMLPGRLHLTIQCSGHCFAHGIQILT